MDPGGLMDAEILACCLCGANMGKTPITVLGRDGSFRQAGPGSRPSASTPGE